MGVTGRGQGRKDPGAIRPTEAAGLIIDSRRGLTDEGGQKRVGKGRWKRLNG